jgi:hypothetical protein
MQRAELLSTAGVAPYLDCYDLRQLFWKSDSKQKRVGDDRLGIFLTIANQPTYTYQNVYRLTKDLDPG